MTAELKMTAGGYTWKWKLNQIDNVHLMLHCGTFL